MSEPNLDKPATPSADAGCCAALEATFIFKGTDGDEDEFYEELITRILFVPRVGDEVMLPCESGIEPSEQPPQKKTRVSDSARVIEVTWWPSETPSLWQVGIYCELIWKERRD